MRYHGNYFQFVSISDTNVTPASDECGREENYVGEHHAYPLKCSVVSVYTIKFNTYVFTHFSQNI